jgi:hypothetical protein
MIKLDRASYLLSDRELIDGIAQQIFNCVGAQDWETHIEMIADFVAPVIHWSTPEFVEYLKRRINQIK